MRFPPGDIGVLTGNGVAHGGDRNAERGEPVGVDPDIDRPLEPADDGHLTHAQRSLELGLGRLVRDLCETARTVSSPESAMVRTGESLSNLETMGGSASSGKRRIAAATRSRTSCARPRYRDQGGM